MLRNNGNCKGKTFFVLPHLKRISQYRTAVFVKGIGRKKAKRGILGISEALMK